MLYILVLVSISFPWQTNKEINSKWIKILPCLARTLLSLLVLVSQETFRDFQLITLYYFRDLKAENLLLGLDGSWKLCDFGSTSTIHKRFEKLEEMGTEEDSIRKHTTPAYRAPEVLEWTCLEKKNVPCFWWTYSSCCILLLLSLLSTFVSLIIYLILLVSHRYGICSEEKL